MDAEIKLPLGAAFLAAILDGIANVPDTIVCTSDRYDGQNTLIICDVSDIDSETGRKRKEEVKHR